MGNSDPGGFHGRIPGEDNRVRKESKLSKHPIQPLVEDEHGTLRFKANAIVRYLLDNGGIDLNQIAALPFDRDDREQFAQLIGYSHSGAGDLGYVSDEVWIAAQQMHEGGWSEDRARLQVLRNRQDSIKGHIRSAAVELFAISPEDLDDR